MFHCTAVFKHIRFLVGKARSSFETVFLLNRIRACVGATLAGLCCAAVGSAQFCTVCVGQVHFLTNETDLRVFFPTKSSENIRRETETEELVDV